MRIAPILFGLWKKKHIRSPLKKSWGRPESQFFNKARGSRQVISALYLSFLREKPLTSQKGLCYPASFNLQVKRISKWHVWK